MSIFDEEDIISSYGDDEALADGVLIDISGYGVRMPDGTPVTRITHALHTQLLRSHKPEQLPIVISAYAEFAIDSNGDGYLYNYDSRVWFVHNEHNTFTAMLPSDY